MAIENEMSAPHWRAASVAVGLALMGRLHPRRSLNRSCRRHVLTATMTCDSAFHCRLRPLELPPKVGTVRHLSLLRLMPNLDRRSSLLRDLLE